MSVDGRASSGLDGLARARPERALLLAADTGTAPWSVTESLDELEELARTAGAEVVGRLSQRLEHPDPRTYLGRGKLQEARDIAVDQQADLIIVDDELAPNTQRAMEEIDRRLIRTRIGALKREIEGIRVHRAGQRSARERAGVPVVALIGYTNAGKSTLFNCLTQAGAVAEDKLV